MPQIIQIPIEYKRLFDRDWREAAIYGGRYSLKSHTVARMLLIRARMEKTRIACFREFQNSIAESSHQLLVDLINEYELHDFKATDNAIINTRNGSDFLFKGLHHNEQSIKSIEGIDIAWVEEAQTISNNSLEVLTPTIRKPGSQIVYTYNRLLEDDPVHVRLVTEGRPNTLIINANYDIALKYGYMPDIIRDELEADKLYRPSLYKHKWLGQPNSQELRIYEDWEVLDRLPKDARLNRRGLDFGYTNDPTAILEVYDWNGSFILNELVYEKRLSNRDIVERLLELDEPDTPVYADSAEPKSIDEIAAQGVNIYASFKGPGSISAGIQYVQSQKFYVIKSSKNLIYENRHYLWQQDKDGRTINKPEDRNNHLMDALRYALESYWYNLLADSKFAGPKPPKPYVSKPTPHQGLPDGTVESQPPVDIGKLLKNAHTGAGRDWRSL